VHCQQRVLNRQDAKIAKEDLKKLPRDPPKQEYQLFLKSELGDLGVLAVQQFPTFAAFVSYLSLV